MVNASKGPVASVAGFRGKDSGIFMTPNSELKILGVFEGTNFYVSLDRLRAENDRAFKDQILIFDWMA